MSMTRPHVLIVEDDADAQQVTRHILEFLDVDTDCVGDAEDAERLLLDQPALYTLAIIDLALPGKDGWQLLGNIQSGAATAHLRCVAVTAFHRPLLREQALQAGFIEYFPKPINPPVFAESIAQLIGLH
jgi:CheY-like chemotaxis protein